MQGGPGPAILWAVTGPVVLDGKYELVEMAGEGGMASVWKAQVKGAAHERRRPDGTAAPIVHRDVSPHNILLGSNGAVKLTDFGLARARDRMVSLTAPGTVKGKLSYLSPEVAMGGQATPASDLFAMGAVMWESLTGERLFDGRSDLDVFKLIRQCIIRPLATYRDDLPAELIAIIERALAKEPGDRFGSASSFAFMLGEVLRYAPPGADPQLTLAQRVAEHRARLGARRVNQVINSDNVPTWTYEKPKPTVPGVPSLRRDASPPPPPLSPASSIDIEIADPEPLGTSADPIPLTTKKKKDQPRAGEATRSTAREATCAAPGPRRRGRRGRDRPAGARCAGPGA